MLECFKLFQIYRFILTKLARAILWYTNHTNMKSVTSLNSARFVFLNHTKKKCKLNIEEGLVSNSKITAGIIIIYCVRKSSQLILSWNSFHRLIAFCKFAKAAFNENSSCFFCCSIINSKNRFVFHFFFSGVRSTEWKKCVC